MCPLSSYENTQDGVQLGVRLEDENVWLNQAVLDEKVVYRSFRHTT